MLSTMMAHPHGPPVSQNGGGFGTDRVALPLNLLISIISHLDSPADLARACRTCRILHYMCLPKLYENVVLRSYDHIRYSDETLAPEGMGGGSPFTMGLNALVTRNVVQYVKRFELHGKMQEYGLEENAAAGRVPDGGMMLAVLVRAALDRMPSLATFTWNLRTKMLPTVWEGLAAKTNITSLTVRMPSTRHPAPTINAPLLPNLKYLHVMEIDPACYPDNIADLLYRAHKLEVLKLHFSPRMRREREPSVSLDSFFGKVKTSDYKMQLKVLALQNLYAGGNGGNYADMYNASLVEEITLIDSSGGADNDASMSFVAHFPVHMPKFESVIKLRGNKASLRHAQAARMLLKNLQCYHMITGRPQKDLPFPQSPIGPNGSVSQTNSPMGGFNEIPSMTSTPSQGDQGGSTGQRSSSMNASDKSSRGEIAVEKLLPHYIDSICAEPRRALRQLLLFPHWKLTTDHLTSLVRYCPNIEQLGLAVEPPALDVIHYLAPHLPKMTILRILNASDFLNTGDDLEAVTEWYEERIGGAAWNKKNSTLRWVGVGDLFFELHKGDDYEADIDGTRRKARRAKRVPLSKVMQLEIWSTDVLEI